MNLEGHAVAVVLAEEYPRRAQLLAEPAQGGGFDLYQAVEKSQSPRGSGKMAAILFCRSQPKPMRGLDLKQNELFSYTTLEQRIPNDHPLRPLRGLVDTVLASMDRD
ncbi:TPA: hypothetical protein ACXJSM_006501, partial [Pseudomonas aeruginosa]